jgi:hypothetical protein
LHSPGGFAGLLHRGQQQGNQNGDDRDHHEKFDEGKTPTLASAFHGKTLFE